MCGYHNDGFVSDPTQVIGLFPDLLPSEFRKQLEYPAPPPPLTAGELEKGCLALVEYLTQVSLITTKTGVNLQFPDCLHLAVILCVKHSQYCIAALLE